MKHADYSWQQLSDWRDDVTDHVLGSVPGVVFDDLDEARNRVTIGVVAGLALSGVNNALADLGIPTTAVIIESTEPVRPAALRMKASVLPRSFPPTGLQTVSDSLGGGLQLQLNNGGPGYPTGTLGLVVDIGANRGFLTVSHLSSSFLSPDTSHLFQASTGGNNVGYEYSDPSGTRNSDASFYLISGSAPGRRGAILRPTNRNSGSGGSLSVSSTSPWINLTGGEATVVNGATVDKVGRSSGWTYGNVNQTCTDITELGVTIHCTYRAGLYCAGGDSGSPIFWYDGADGGVFFGMLFGGCSAGQMYFSSYSDITTDLGSMSVNSEITVGTPALSGSVSSGDASLSWSAVSTTHTSATTTYQIYRSTWAADLGIYLDNNVLVTTITSTSFTDTGAQISVNSY